MNNDLISRKALVAALLEEREHYPPDTEERYSFGVKLPNRFNQAMRGGIRKALRLIEIAKAVDAEPVRRGYNATTTFYSDLFVCSECGLVCEITKLEYEDGDIPGMGVPNAYEYDCNYCPNCGARMDLEVQDG